LLTLGVETVEYVFTAWEESDGEFSLYDDESAGFMSHYVALDEIIERFKTDARMDGGDYRVVVKGIDGETAKEIVIVTPQ
jgi:hypothetical protein